MSAPSLREQQQALLAAMISPDEPTALPWLQPRPDGRPPLLSIYRHAYRARLAGALADNYPVLRRAMGDDAFDALAQGYLAAHPSREPSIRWFGHRLAEFIAQGDTPGVHPALADLARMEWALRSAFDAADAPVLGLDALAALPPDEWATLCLQAHPSVQLLRLQWSVEAGYRTLAMVEADGDAPEPDLPEPAAHAHALLVWRQAFDTRWRSLDDEEAALLHAAIGGASFATLCEQAAEGRDASQAAITAARLLQQWLHDGLFTTASTTAFTDLAPHDAAHKNDAARS